MKKYKIELFGRGAECFIHELTDDQRQKLEDGNVEDEGMSLDEICKVIEKDSITDTDVIVTGAYHEKDLYHFYVYDENDNKIWESDSDFELDIQDEDYMYSHNEPNQLICEDLIKGHFFTFILNTEQDFDPNKLNAIIDEVGEYIPLIVGIKYNGEKVEVDEYGSYWDKGYNFYLS